VGIQKLLRRLTWMIGVVLVGSALPLLLTWRTAPDPVAPATLDAPGAVVLELKPGATEADVVRLDQETGLDLQENSIEFPADHVMRANVDPGQETAALQELSADPAVEYAEPEHRYQFPASEETSAPYRGPAIPERQAGSAWTPNDPRYPEQWNFRLVAAEKAWEVTRGKGAVVAVIDTGVAFEKDDQGCYQARDFTGTGFVRGYDFIHKNIHPNDDQGHGTHVAGTIAESTNNREGCAGLAPAARIMPVKVLSKEGYGTTGDIADGIRFAADHGANVINMSLGSPFPSPILHSACQYAYKKGVTIVCAAGNSGGEGVGYPAAFKECIAVSAVGPTGKLAPYSSYGPQIAIAAPGGDKTLGENAGILQNTVLGGVDDYYSFQGTSMACPHVAAVAALLVSQGIKDPGEVRAALQRAARPKAPANQYGAGLLDAGAAVSRGASWNVERPAWWLLSLAVIGLCTALGITRRRLAGVPGYPIGATAALVLGLLGPDWLASSFGFASHLNMIGHSLLIPALLLTEVESRSSLRWVALLATALTAHLMWELHWGTAPFSAMAGWQSALWLWANTAAGVTVTFIALARGHQARR
jgi:serine protease